MKATLGEFLLNYAKELGELQADIPPFSQDRLAPTTLLYGVLLTFLVQEKSFAT